MKRIILFVLFGGFNLPVLAQDGADYSFWSDLEDDKKVAFVQGYYTGLARGLKVLGQEAARMRNQDKYWSPPFSHENSAKRISEFFTDPMPDYAEIARMIDALFEMVTLDFPLRAYGDNGQIDMTVSQIGGRPLALDDLEAERISIKFDHPLHVLGENS